MDIDGTPENDDLIGTTDGDVINGLAGDDIINMLTRPSASGSPVDVADGGTGFDTLVVDASAETGSVSLNFGFSPRLTVRSQSGNFWVEAYNFERVLFTGGSGNDTINTGDLPGTVDGGGGDDFWTANLGHVFSNVIFTLGTTTSIAAAGLTSITNIEGINLTTGSGNDRIVGGSMADIIATGDGNDVINARTRPSASGSPIDVVDGGDGTDTLLVNASSETQSVTLTPGTSPSFTVRSVSNNFWVDAYNIEKVEFTGGSGNDAINTGTRGGKVNGRGGVDYWLADLGGLSGDVDFTLGTTSSIAEAGLTSILNLERIHLTTGSGNDTIVGGNQADTISTGNGDDTINARTRPSASGSPIDIVDGGNGFDTLIVNASPETQSVTLTPGTSPSFTLRSVSNKYWIDAYSIERILFTGGGGRDTVNTGTRGGTVDGGGGVDHWLADLSALSGDVSFTLGTTTAIAEAGLTSILRIERIDLTTGSGNDTIIGGSQADMISTGNGDDTIDAKTRPSASGSPIDIVNGGNGVDTLIVNAGSETQSVTLTPGTSPSFTVRSASNNFWIDAYSIERILFTGGSGDDTINTGTGGGVVNGGGGTDYWIADLSALAGNVRFTLGTTTAISEAGLTSIRRIERINLTTGSGNDRIAGGAEGDAIITGNGDDIINAGTRSPVSGAPIDVVNGGNGIDTLIVDASAETQSVTLTPGTSPSFTVRSTSNNFWIDAYLIEKVEFTGGSGNDTATGGARSDILIMGGGNDVVHGGGGADTVDGGAGNDTIRGGKGGDTLIGGTGVDNFIYDGLADSRVASGDIDRIMDFETGVDLINLSAIDANAFIGDADQAFTFVGAAGFSGGVRGELRAVSGLVEADVNGDGVADFRILIDNGATLAAADFIL